MRKFNQLIILILLFNNCQTQKNIIGIWVGGYEISNYGNRIYPIHPALFEIDESEITMVSFDFPDNGIIHSNTQETFKYKLNKDLIIINPDNNPDTIKLISISRDSLIVSIQESNDIVLKKVRIKNSKQDVDLLDRAFVMKNNNYQDSIDFISDTTFLHIGETNKFRQDRWFHFKYKELSLLIFFGLNNFIYFINHVEPNSFQIRAYYDNEYNFELTEISSEKDLKLIEGSWKEMSTTISGKTQNPPLPPGITEEEQKLKLRIEEDTVELGKYNHSRKVFWKANSTNQFLIIPSFYKSNEPKFIPEPAYWKVLELTDERLKIERKNPPSGLIEYEIIEFQKVIKADNNDKHP